MNSFQVSEADSGQRLDQFLHRLQPQYSRSRIQEWIKAGHAPVNGGVQKASYQVRAGDTVQFEAGSIPSLKAFAEDLPVKVLYSDADVLVVDKPPGMVVHSGAGNHEGTLVNALLHHFESLSTHGGEDRPGIVHRIDRETSGVLVVARTDAAHRHLAEQFASREVEKVYLALVQGQVPKEQGTITAAITRDPVRRIKMTTRMDRGRSALTSYRVIERLPAHSYLEVKIGTGRTHQIRVHMASIKHPVAGDTLYGARAADYGRFFLHAHRLRFASPTSGEMISVESPLPEELERWLAEARNPG